MSSGLIVQEHYEYYWNSSLFVVIDQCNRLVLRQRNDLVMMNLPVEQYGNF